jgi:paraquat-inducible protein A
MYYSGAYSENTVWDGVVSLAHYNQWFVAAVVLMASIVIPLVKLVSLLYLVASVQLKSRAAPRLRTKLWHFVDVIGPWAMLDVFLLAVLVALVKLRTLATILPGPGLAAFCAVVVLTILASSTFDPRLIWTTSQKPALTAAARTVRAVPVSASATSLTRYIAIPSNECASRCQS